MRTANDGSFYVREQKGHSIVKHFFIGIFCLWINMIYITISPNHYWHL